MYIALRYSEVNNYIFYVIFLRTSVPDGNYSQCLFRFTLVLYQFIYQCLFVLKHN